MRDDNGVLGLIDWWHDLRCGAFMTKPKNAFRFDSAICRTTNREVHPERFRGGATMNVVVDSDKCTIAFLVPDSESDRLLDRAGVGKLEYNPWNDIDRYLVKCHCGNVDDQRCPMWEKLRTLCRSGLIAREIVDRDFLAAHVNKDPAYGEVGQTYIGDGDGSVGPIAARASNDSVSPVVVLVSLCLTCPYAVEDKRGGRDGEGRKRDDERDVECVCHGGIIAFFRRLFRRGKDSASTKEVQG